MTTIEAVIFGMLLSWTPCVVLMAYLFVARPARMGPDRLRRRDSKFSEFLTAACTRKPAVFSYPWLRETEPGNT